MLNVVMMSVATLSKCYFLNYFFDRKNFCFSKMTLKLSKNTTLCKMLKFDVDFLFGDQLHIKLVLLTEYNNFSLLL